MTAREMPSREEIARCIIGPRLPVPIGSRYSLAELRKVRWDMASHAERNDALNAADAILSLDLISAARAEGERAMREKAAKVADSAINPLNEAKSGTARAIARRIRALPIADPSPPPAEEVKANAYQIIGALADHAGLFEHPEVIRALDYLAYDKGGEDILPWPREPLPEAPAAEGGADGA